MMKGVKLLSRQNYTAKGTNTPPNNPNVITIPTAKPLH